MRDLTARVESGAGPSTGLAKLDGGHQTRLMTHDDYNKQEAVILVWCDDLMMSSRIRNATDAPVRVVRTLHDLLQLAGNTHVRRVVVDMAAKTADMKADLAKIGEAFKGSELLAFGSHTKTDLFDAAKSAGFDEVMPNSLFAKRIQSYLA